MEFALLVLYLAVACGFAIQMVVQDEEETVDSFGWAVLLMVLFPLVVGALIASRCKDVYGKRTSRKKDEVGP